MGEVSTTETAQPVFFVEWHERGSRSGLGPGGFRVSEASATALPEGRLRLNTHDGARVLSLRDPSRRYIPWAAHDTVTRLVERLQGDERALAVRALQSMLVPIGDALAATIAIRNADVEQMDIELQGLIATGENSRTEFKESLLWALVDERPDLGKDVGERVAVVELSAFANADGGIVLFGVRDDGAVCGIESDLRILRERLGKRARSMNGSSGLGRGSPS